MTERQERAWKAGARVRIDAPGYSFHRQTGTVAMDMLAADKVLFVLRDCRGRDSSGICSLGSSEVARLRNQQPNPDHTGDFTAFWWKR